MNECRICGGEFQALEQHMQDWHECFKHWMPHRTEDYRMYLTVVGEQMVSCTRCGTWWPLPSNMFPVDAHG